MGQAALGLSHSRIPPCTGPEWPGRSAGASLHSRSCDKKRPVIASVFPSPTRRPKQDSLPGLNSLLFHHPPIPPTPSAPPTTRAQHPDRTGLPMGTTQGESAAKRSATPSKPERQVQTENRGHVTLPGEGNVTILWKSS